MSTHYYIYAEVMVKGKWYNLNPIIKRYDGTFALHPIYDCTSIFFDVCNDLEEQRISVGIPDDMSPELRAIFHTDLDEKCDQWIEGTTWRQIYERSMFCVRYEDAIFPRIIKDKPHKYEGYVSKRMIADFEVHEIDEIYNWLSKEEYDALPDNKKIKFSYYQWDEDFSDYQIYRTIHERLSALLYWFDYADAFPDKSDYWPISPTINDVRLFVDRV